MISSGVTTWSRGKESVPPGTPPDSNEPCTPAVTDDFGTTFAFFVSGAGDRYVESIRPDGTSGWRTAVDRYVGAYQHPVVGADGNVWFNLHHGGDGSLQLLAFDRTSGNIEQSIELGQTSLGGLAAFEHGLVIIDGGTNSVAYFDYTGNPINRISLVGHFNLMGSNHEQVPTYAMSSTDGTFFVTGWTDCSQPTDENHHIAKLTPDGIEWIGHRPGTCSQTALVATPDGGAVLERYPNGGDRNVTEFVSYGPDGTERWTRRIENRDPYGMSPLLPLADEFGNVGLLTWLAKECPSQCIQSTGVHGVRVEFVSQATGEPTLEPLSVSNGQPCCYTEDWMVHSAAVATGIIYLQRWPGGFDQGPSTLTAHAAPGLGRDFAVVVRPGAQDCERDRHWDGILISAPANCSLQTTDSRGRLSFDVRALTDAPPLTMEIEGDGVSCRRESGGTDESGGRSCVIQMAPNDDQSSVTARIADGRGVTVRRWTVVRGKAADLNGDGRVRVAVLGDSYISGEGEGPYDACTDIHGLETIADDPCRPSHTPAVAEELRARKIEDRNLCHRARHSWAVQVASHLGASSDDLLFAACSGAETRHVTHVKQYPASPNGVHGGEPQATTLQNWAAAAPADVVFVSVGGNNLPFRDVVTECFLFRNPCAKPTSASQGTTAYQRQVMSELPRVAREVRDSLLEVKRRGLSTSPKAEVFLVGYPIPAKPARMCGSSHPTWYSTTWEFTAEFTVQEQNWLSQDLVPELNRHLRLAAAEAGVGWIDGFASVFEGNGICGDPPYLNSLVAGDDIRIPPLVGPKVLGNESFHPNKAGHNAWAAHVRTSLPSSGLGGGMPSPTDKGLGGKPGPLTVAPVLTGSSRLSADARVVQVTITAQPVQNSSDPFALPAGVPLRVAAQSLPTDVWSGSSSEGTTLASFEVPASWAPGLHSLELRRTDTQPHTVLAVMPVWRDVDPACDASTTPGPDVDGDGLLDRCDRDPDDGPKADADADAITNGKDNCPLVSNGAQVDSDEDGVGDACDDDLGFDPFSVYRTAIDPGTEDPDLEDDEQLVYIGRGGIFAIHPSGERPERRLVTLGSGVDPGRFSVAPDRKTLAIDVSGDATTSFARSVYLASLTDGAAARPLSAAAGTDQAGAVWSPDGTRLAVLQMPRSGTEEAQLVTTTPDGSQATTLAGDADFFVPPAWSPDGKRIAFVAAPDPAGGRVLSIVDIGNGNGNGQRSNHRLRDAGQDLEWVSHLRWSPDGQRIAFSDFQDVFVIRPDGTGLANLTQNPDGQRRHSSQPRWSPDGTLIAFVDTRNPHGTSCGGLPVTGPGNAPGEIFTITPEGTGLKRVSTATAGCTGSNHREPNWSPAGDRLTFVDTQFGPVSCGVPPGAPEPEPGCTAPVASFPATVSVAGTEQLRLPSDSFFHGNPTWLGQAGQPQQPPPPAPPDSESPQPPADGSPAPSPPTDPTLQPQPQSPTDSSGPNGQPVQVENESATGGGPSGTRIPLPITGTSVALLVALGIVLLFVGRFLTALAGPPSPEDEGP